MTHDNGFTPPMPMPPAVAPPQWPEAMEHEAGPECWCEPELAYVDPETGAAVYVHRTPQ